MDSAQLQQRYAAGDRVFCRLDLSGLDLSGLDFQDADFSGSDLYGVKLINACLHRARFGSRANLAYADLSGADLSGADLRSTILEGANLEAAVTRGLLYDASTQFPAGFNPTTAGAITVQGQSSSPSQIALPAANFATESEMKGEFKEIRGELNPAPYRLPLASSVPPERQKAPDIEPEPALLPPMPQSNSPSPLSINIPTPYSFNAEEIANEELSKQIETEMLTPPIPEPAIQKRTSHSRLLFLFGCCFVTGGLLAILSAGLMSLLGGQRSSNPFESLQYPRSACGDSLPSQARDFPVNLYPVYASYSLKDLTLVKTKYCQDAFVVNRKDVGRVIQVASFRSADRAQQFATLMQKRVGSGFVGSQTQILKIK